MPPNANEHNLDELVPPEWLNKEFFAKVLKFVEKNENIEVDNLKLAPATAKGDHYASIMFRALIDFKSNDIRKNVSLVLKALPEMDGHKKDVLQESFIFETEIGMYTEVVPKFKEILKANGIERTIGPNCLYYSLTPKKVIVFEDILPLGFEIQRKQKLTLHEIKTAYGKLAEWHAVSHKILMEQSEFFEPYRYGLINMKSFNESIVIKNGTMHFTQTLAEHEDLAMYVPYFEALAEKNLLQCAIDSFNEYRDNPQNSTFYVLCHGDFHYKNMMCKRDPKTKALLDLMLLDFQLCYVGPAVNDLIYSFFLLLDNEQRLEHFDELFYSYFVKLNDTLEKIGCNGVRPKMLDLRYQLMRYKELLLFLLTTFFPVWFSFCDGNFDEDLVNESADYHKSLFENPNFLAELRAILPKLLHLGYLES